MPGAKAPPCPPRRQCDPAPKLRAVAAHVCMCAAAAAWELSDQQREELRTAFDTVDVSGDVKLDFAELRSLLKSLGQTFTDAEVRQKLREVDTDGSGDIGFSEFVTLMQWQDEEMRNVFAFCDDDASGSMSMEELRAALGLIGRELSDDGFAALARQVDADGSGFVDAEEFSAFIRPMMSFTQQNSFAAEYSGAEVSVSITPFGIELQGGAGLPRGVIPFALSAGKSKGLTGCRVDEDAVLLSVATGDEQLSVKLTCSSGNAQEIQARIKEGNAKKRLRAPLALNKQKLELRGAFDMVDVSGDGELDLDELRTLLDSLGQQCTDAQLRDKVRQLDVDGSGTIGLSEFEVLMRDWQGKYVCMLTYMARKRFLLTTPCK